MSIPIEVVSAIAALITAPVAAAVSWRLMRRNHVVTADLTVAQGANMAVETMLVVLDQLRREVEDLTREAELLRQENKILHEEVARLRAIVNNLGGSQ